MGGTAGRRRCLGVSADDRRLAVVTNPSSAGGRSLKLMPEVKAQLESLGLPHRFVETRDIGHAAEAAGEAAAAGEVVVAMGGDGVVGALAGAVRDKGRLAVLPAGRGNDFARELAIPPDMVGACRVIAEGQERRLDLAEVNGRPFVCIASTGFDSEANRIANQARLIRGNLVYLYAALRALAAWKPARFTVRMDDREEAFAGYTVAVANTRFYGGGMRVAPCAKPDDGMFDVVFVERNSKLRFLANLPKVFSGKHVEVDGVRSFRGREVQIEADRAFDVYADGEALTELPANVRVLPGLLRVIVPR
jgi:YegS/Rv2252/BmrU family lipid kinase